MLITASEIINKSWTLYQKNYRVIAHYLLLLFIPTGLMAIASVIIGSFTAVFLTFGLGVPLIVYLAMGLLASIASLWLSISLMRAIYSFYLGSTTKSLKENLQTSLQLIWPAILISLVSSLIIFGGLLLLIIPGLMLIIWLAFSFYAVILDNQRVTDSLSTSRNLVRGRWWAVLWRLIAPAAVFGIFLFLLQWLISIPIELILRNFTEGNLVYTVLLAFFTLIGVITSLLFTPLSSAAIIILYQELKNTPAEKV